MAFKQRFAGANMSFGSMVGKIKEIWAISKGRSQLISYFVLVFLFFCPLILCAIVFAVSTPTAAARTAIYLVTAAFALVATGYWTFITRRKIRKILAKHDRDSYRMRQRTKQTQKLPTHHVNTAVDAFNSEQRIYEQDMANYNLQPNGQQYQMPDQNDYLPYAPLQMPVADTQTNNLYLVPMPMPMPRTEPLQVRNTVEPEEDNRVAQQMPMPQPPPPTYSGNLPLLPPLPAQPHDQHSDSASTLPPIPPLPPLQILAPQARTRPQSTLGQPSVVGQKSERGQQKQQGSAIDFDSEDESSDDDDESVKLFSFDKVKVRSDSPQEHQRYGSPSRMNVLSSVDSVSNPSASQQSLVIASNQLQNEEPEPADKPLHKAVDTSSGSNQNINTSGQMSLSDLPSQPDTMSSGTKSVLDKFPEPPKSKLRLSVFPQNNTSEADLVEKWLQTSSPPEPPNPALRQLAQQNAIGSSAAANLSSSAPDLVVPDKFAPAEGTKIVKSPTQPLPQTQNVSIYGERDALANIENSDAAGSHLDLPRRPRAPTTGQDASEDRASPPAVVVAPAVVDRPPLDMSKPDPRDLAEIDQPLLESSDLSLRRPTLVDYQKKADAKRKMMLASLDESLSKAALEQQADLVQPKTNDEAGDSRYFSAVSLPQQQQPPAPKPAVLANFAAIREEMSDDDDGFLDSDSDDEPTGAVLLAPKGTAKATTEQINSPIAPKPRPLDAGESNEVRPPSTGFENLAAQLAMAITNNNNNGQQHDSLISTHAAGLRESLLYNVQSPGASPKNDEYSMATTSMQGPRGALLNNRQLNSVLFDEPRAPPRPSDSSIFLDGEDYGADLVELNSINRGKN
ncbi:hypothetical protein GGF40_002350 [Coemansia sp. RSA 1286]|nr:hypothetical protein IWW45_000894 [Coemansia sp. RSA 485]KAJ2598938.1 hypothetical protein GGF39_002443 [Coemansia sp. RSA 1721]KAJ2637449.1 hypothetical protein GGF40_002350 [Coemansia sp. RSA 1286]